MIEIYTDGACIGNPGPGGWGAVIVRDGTTEELGGHEARTTNNRMELRAAIEALTHVPANEAVRVFSDSQYVLNGITKWLPGWKRRGWLTAEDKPVENRELWEALEAAAGTRTKWEYVRGHAGNPGNERANQIAQAHAAHRTPPPAGTAATNTPVPGNRRLGVSYLSLVRGEVRRHATWDECKARVDRVSSARYKKCASAAEEAATLTAWGVRPDALEAPH
jgi:ribonuclease HI